MKAIKQVKIAAIAAVCVSALNGNACFNGECVLVCNVESTPGSGSCSLGEDGK